MSFPVLTEFDCAFYRKSNRDLSSLNDNLLREHFREIGITEGRAGSAHAIRNAFVELLSAEQSILEIGPFANPVARGNKVRYYDVLPTDQLRQRAVRHGLDPNRCPPIDFSSPNGDLSVVDARFSAVVSSHVIEHQIDLISHLGQVSQLLEHGGRYFLLIPDKRYCFDHFIAESSIAEVVGAHLRKGSVHQESSVIEHLALTTHNDPARHWSGDHGQPAYTADPEKINEAIRVCLRSSGEYVDTHAWQFTPRSFREIIGALAALRLIHFNAPIVQETVAGSNEFYAVLEKNSRDAMPLPQLPEDFIDSLYLLANPDVAAQGIDAKVHYISFGYRESRKLRP